jgi:hypothetical protein
MLEPGPGDSSRWGRRRRRATTTTIASSTGLGSARRAACATGRRERHGMGAWQQQGGAGARRPDGKAAAGEDCRVGENDGRATPWMRPRRSHACGSGGKKCRCVFIFLDKSVILKVKWRRPVGPDRWTGPGTSRPDGTRLDEHPCSNIIVK